MAPRLNTLVIENFRSIKGQIVVPLDAQVVLVHGTNGMGKTSVLSALELALTGRVAHLAAQGETYKEFLTNLGQNQGSIKLTTSGNVAGAQSASGSVAFSEGSFDAQPLLNDSAARFFGERCYLPQTTLGRLLEIYNDQKTSTNSPLTQFVKELLGLDPLDALADGLNSAFHVTRIRNLVPEYRRAEAVETSLSTDLDRVRQALAKAQERTEAGRAEAARLLAELGIAALNLDAPEEVKAQREAVAASQAERDRLSSLERLRAELRAATTTWRSLPAFDAEREQAIRDREVHSMSEALAVWRGGPGAALASILARLADYFPELPNLDDGPAEARATAFARAIGESERCEKLRMKAGSAVERQQALKQTIERSNTRIAELDQALLASADNTKSLAAALAAVAPHIHTDQCPVCDRDFREQNAGPLSAHVATKVAALTTEAGRLQALAVERAEVTTRLSTAQRDLLAVERELLPPAELAELTNRASLMSGFAEQLRALESEMFQGTALIEQSRRARGAASAARRASELSSSILPEIERLVTSILEASIGSFESVDAAILRAEQCLDEQISAARNLVSIRVTTIGQLEDLARDLADRAEAQVALAQAEASLKKVWNSFAMAGSVRDTAKGASDAAQRVRSRIVKRVFNTSLNRTWRDLFVRLAPSEDFVPAFKIPVGEKDKVEAVLETVHRSGKSSGTPGAMLSQGNLNTAALTLFLALHLSVPQRTPWLVLDDPVQSMDDVHTAQFAALLRSLSKSAGRQVVVAVHERALFDYLTLELSPAFPGDSLITVEIDRNFEGETVARPIPHNFEDDRVIAA